MNDHLSKPTVAFEVDTDAFGDVLQALGAEQVDALVESVVADIGHLITHLNVGGGPETLDAVGREAHHLSGGCRSMGLVSIGAVCARIETEARERVDHSSLAGRCTETTDERVECGAPCTLRIGLQL